MIKIGEKIMIQQQNVTVHSVKKLLEHKGVKPSYQRLSILKYLMENMNHPSVDRIFISLSQEIPTLSKMTVYNTLNLLQSKGIVSAIKIRENEVIYDFITKPHAHFECSNCGSIIDIEIDNEILTLSEIDNHKISEAQIHLKGVCKNCQN